MTENYDLYFHSQRIAGGGSSGGSIILPDQVYSLEERRIGSWMGKPLYQRTYSLTTPDIANGWYEIIPAESDWDFVMVDSAYIVLPTGVDQYPILIAGGGFSRIRRDANGGIYWISTTDTYINKPIWITLRYTKTEGG